MRKALGMKTVISSIDLELLNSEIKVQSDYFVELKDPVATYWKRQTFLAFVVGMVVNISNVLY